MLPDGVPVVLSKRIRRTDQDWSKYLPVYKGFNVFSCEYQTNFVSRIIATKRRAEALPAAQTEFPRERVTVKFRDEDAEAVMAKALEGGSDSEKEEQLFPEPKEIPAAAMKRDGSERKTGGEETPSKKQQFLFADEKTLEEVKAYPSTSLPAGQPNPIIPIQSSLRSPSAPSRPREAVELLEEESPMKKLRLQARRSRSIW